MPRGAPGGKLYASLEDLVLPKTECWLSEWMESGSVTQQQARLDYSPCATQVLTAAIRSFTW